MHDIKYHQGGSYGFVKGSEVQEEIAGISIPLEKQEMSLACSSAALVVFNTYHDCSCEVLHDDPIPRRVPDPSA